VVPRLRSTAVLGGWGRWGSAAALGLALAAAVACGGGSDGPEGGTAATPSGGELYAGACSSCHGTDLRGTERGPSHLSVVYEPGHHPDAAFRSAVLSGSPQHHWTFGDMPPVTGLDDAEIDAVIAYIRKVQEREGFEPYPP
jgi:mono/diheme cytochrome c family protein